MRLFIGIDFEDKQQNNLCKMQQAFESVLQNGRATRQENMHCTLLFLCEVDATKVPDICQTLHQVSKRHGRFLTSFFDSANFANGCAVIKLKATKQLIALQQDIESNLQQYTKKPTNKYIPHVTIYRDAKFSLPFREAKKTVQMLNMPFEVTNFTLFYSTRGENGMIYTPITYFNLNKQP